MGNNFVIDHCILFYQKYSLQYKSTYFKCVKRIYSQISNMITHDNMIP